MAPQRWASKGSQKPNPVGGSITPVSRRSQYASSCGVVTIRAPSLEARCFLCFRRTKNEQEAPGTLGLWHRRRPKSVKQSRLFGPMMQNTAARLESSRFDYYSPAFVPSACASSSSTSSTCFCGATNPFKLAFSPTAVIAPCCLTAARPWVRPAGIPLFFSFVYVPPLGWDPAPAP